METRCPCCGATYALEAAINDEAGTELLTIVAKHSAHLTRPLVAYLGLFRPVNRKLSWSRALKLANEVLSMSTEQHLAVALSETVEALREKQLQGGWKPMRNHNYLKRVLESVENCTVVSMADNSVSGSPRPQKLSKHAAAIQALDEN